MPTLILMFVDVWRKRASKALCWPRRYFALAVWETLIIQYQAWTSIVFARSDAAATIYFVTQSCATTIREHHLLNSEVYCHCHWCRDWGARPLCQHWRGWKRVGGERSCSRRLLVLCFLLFLNLNICFVTSYKVLFTSTHATQIRAAASIRERPLFRSAYRNVQWQFENGY